MLGQSHSFSKVIGSFSARKIMLTAGIFPTFQLLSTSLTPHHASNVCAEETYEHMQGWQPLCQLHLQFTLKWSVTPQLFFLRPLSLSLSDRLCKNEQKINEGSSKNFNFFCTRGIKSCHLLLGIANAINKLWNLPQRTLQVESI